MKTFKAVIIGMGRMGRTRYITMKKHGGFTVSAVCDVDVKRLGDLDVKKYVDWVQCIDCEKPEVVFVCTVNSVIPDVVCYALTCGCHVFSEKPPGRNLKDAIRMNDVYQKTCGLVLKYGFNHRYHNSIIEAKALVESGVLGDVVAARGVYGKAADYGKDEWRNNSEISGGGILLDQGIHMLDLLRYFLGDISEIEGFTDNLIYKTSINEDTAFATLKTHDGKVATLNSSAIQWKHKFDLDILLTEGYIALNGLLTSTRSYGEESITYYKKDLEQKSGKIGNPVEYTLCFDEDNSWMLEIEEYYNALIGEGKIVNGTIRDAICVMRLIEQIYDGRK